MLTVMTLTSRRFSCVRWNELCVKGITLSYSAGLRKTLSVVVGEAGYAPEGGRVDDRASTVYYSRPIGRNR